VYDLFWINSDTVAKRANWGNGVGRWGKWIGNGDTKGNVNIQIDIIKYLASLKNPSNIDDVIEESIERLMSVPISQAARIRIRTKTLEGVTPSYYTQLYQSHLSKPTDETRSTLTYRIQNMFGALFQMGEIHLF
jgi:prolipoprotein diacylglyceryltransferase